MKYIVSIFSIIISLMIFAGCSKDNSSEEGANKASLTLRFTTPETIKITELSNVVVTLTELNTLTKKQVTLTDKYVVDLDISKGSYEISVDGNVKYVVDNQTFEGGLSAFVSKIDFVENVNTHTIALALKSFSKDFLIEEIFVAGTISPERKQYLGDAYIKLYNNTDKTLYADGLIIAQSKFQTVDKQNYSPNIMNEAFTVDAMIQIPGSGKQYPVEPYKSIVIAVDGINHLEYNINSMDLSKANFEIKDINDDEDPDNPSVTNVNAFYERMVINNQGINSFAIIRLPQEVSKEMYLANYRYTFEWNLVFEGVTYPMSEDAYKIPNAWIVDAVNLSTPTDFQWIVTDSSLDNGWTYCSEHQGDESRYGKAVRRKVLQEIDGKILLQDTNNSSNDFQARVKPSLRP